MWIAHVNGGRVIKVCVAELGGKGIDVRVTAGGKRSERIGAINACACACACACECECACACACACMRVHVCVRARSCTWNTARKPLSSGMTSARGV